MKTGLLNKSLNYCINAISVVIRDGKKSRCFKEKKNRKIGKLL